MDCDDFCPGRDIASSAGSGEIPNSSSSSLRTEARVSEGALANRQKDSSERCVFVKREKENEKKKAKKKGQ